MKPALPLDFHNFTSPIPILEQVAAEYDTLRTALDRASSTAERLDVVHQWDSLRRRLDTWENLVHLRFNQDTRNPAYKEARSYSDEVSPRLTEFAVDMKRQLVNHADRVSLEAALGAQAFALWESQILTYDRAIETDMVREGRLQAEYTELLASASFDFQDEKLNLSSIVKYREHPNRELRKQAEQTRWTWFAENGETLDRIFSELVACRQAMAEKLGFQRFTELGYRRMCRIDYTLSDVERYREEVRQYVVPLCIELKKQQQERIGVDRLMFWDEGLFDVQGNPAPQGDHDWMIERAKEMFDDMGTELGEFFRLMTDAHLIDLKNREGKAGGGFCTSLADYGVPFIFANFNGSKGDVEVFTHEMGHAFQAYASRNASLCDYLWPTYESCEIHSMGLEFLTWPHMEKFFGAEAERFRRIHLTQALLFLPYGVAVDHFQHLVYAEPNATPSRRHAMWQEMEQTYLPWRTHGDLPYVSEGGFWQFQRHIYLQPFYYIDYTLAQCCALQFWLRSRLDFAGAMADFVALCQRGGNAPFQELVRSAGLNSPFAPGCLAEVVTQAHEVLNT